MERGDDPLTRDALEAERQRLREVLAFPDAVEPTPARERQPDVAELESEAVATPEASSEVDSLTRRIDQLTERVATLTSVVEALLDAPPAAHAPVPFTADEFTDVAAHMVHMVDTRLEAQAKRTEQLVADLATRGKAIEAIEENKNFARMDDHLAMISRAVLEAQAEVKALRETIGNATSSVTGGGGASLDVAVVHALDARYEEIATQLIEKMDDTLSARMQRFETLSQAMIALVGEPIDMLTTKLQQLATEREATIDAVESLRAMAETQQRILRRLAPPP